MVNVAVREAPASSCVASPSSSSASVEWSGETRRRVLDASGDLTSREKGCDARFTSSTRNPRRGFSFWFTLAAAVSMVGATRAAGRLHIGQSTDTWSHSSRHSAWKQCSHWSSLACSWSSSSLKQMAQVRSSSSASSPPSLAFFVAYLVRLKGSTGMVSANRRPGTAGISIGSQWPQRSRHNRTHILVKRAPA